MEYNLISIGRLDPGIGVDTIAADDLVVVEVNRPNTGVQTVKYRVDEAFRSGVVSLDDSGSLEININDPIFDSVRDEIPDDLTTQDDLNKLHNQTIKAVVNKVNDLPEVIVSPTTPIKTDIANDTIPHNEGTLWVDPTHFRTYVMFYDRDGNDVKSHIWVGLTDR